MNATVIELSHIYFEGEEPAPGFMPAVKPALQSVPFSVVARKRPGQSAASEPLSAVLRFILQQSGVDADSYQPEALNRRLPACLRALRAPSEAAALALLRGNPELLPSALSAVLIGMSGFFRDPAVFEHLRGKLLPEMLNERRGLRVYSLGCSTGEELYSAAMILDELGGLPESRLLGVDCRADVIAQAESGCFAASQVEALSWRWRRHFDSDGTRYRISPNLRSRVEWRVGGLNGCPEAVSWDLILFRNVAIYLEAEAARRVWRGLGEQLKPGGTLVTGKAERPPAFVGLKQECGCVYRKPLS